MHNRLRTFACTTSIGPGATNMLTGAALATINRLPVLLLPGDIFARRNVAPVLQQLESSASQDISVNDCFKPVSRYWDRINRPEQLSRPCRKSCACSLPGGDRRGDPGRCPRTCRPKPSTTPLRYSSSRGLAHPAPAPDGRLLQQAAPGSGPAASR
jgi:3D-(3,5/4)-trihydroxycyclohexane-1,2-dione acylhydrolase (decyclizing)